MRNKISIVFLVAAFLSAFLAPVDSFAQSFEPTASKLSISGTPQVGQVLTGRYTYVPMPMVTWRVLPPSAGCAVRFVPFVRFFLWSLHPIGATDRTYTLVAADEGALIRFEVTPVAQRGPPNDLTLTPGQAVTSDAVGPVTPAPNDPPEASNVLISGTPQVGEVLTGSYTYFDADDDPEGASTFQWLRVTDPRQEDPLASTAPRTGPTPWWRRMRES